MNFYFAFGFLVSLCILLRWSFSRPSIAYQLHRVRKQTNLHSPVNKTYLKVAPQRFSFRTESKDIRNCHEHVVFTTFKCPKCDRLRETIEENTRHIWSNMDGVTFRVIKETRNNKHGVPILKYMYMDMIRECPASKTFTYINGDVLGSYDFVLTINALLRAGLGDFLMVGRRTNSDWDESHSVLHKNFSFDEHFERGSLFATNAQDYFTVTKNAIDWNAIPSFVIGRPGYDNWLVDHIYHKPKVALVDASRTVRMLHQTDADGNSAQGGKMVKSSADKEYNRILGKGQWDHGRTTHAEWKTSYDGNGKIVLIGGKETDRTEFQIHVLTMNRATSLERLLKSLENAKYDNDKVHLYIHVDKSSNNEECISVAKKFLFSHGITTIDIADEKLGLRKAWFRAWPSPKETEYAIILEDDTEVSVLWYRWLKRAWKAYKDTTDLAGISLQRQTLVPKKPHRQFEIVNKHEPFLYRLVGSIGFSPHPKQWLSFMKWLSLIDLETFDVSVEGLITTDWYRKLNKRHMWTQHFIYFCNKEDLFTLYVNLRNDETLASHMREKGEHYGQTEGRDFSLATDMIMKFPRQLNRYGWDGLSQTERIQKQYGFVLLLFLNKAYLEMTKSFICHQPDLLKQTIFVTTSSQLRKELKAWNPATLVFLQPYAVSKSVYYGTYEYFKLTEERLKFQNNLIQDGINVFVIEADATWNSLQILDIIQNAFKEHDIVSADDDNKLISAGFLGVRSTYKTRKFFKLYVDTYSKHLASFSGQTGHIGNVGEQHTMTRLLKKLGVETYWLTQCESANGKWYLNKDLACPLPMVIQNNWIKGNEAKISRAKENKQWFLDENGECLNSKTMKSVQKFCVDEEKQLQVMMSSEEQKMLESYFTPTTRYFEWGSGGSTDTYPRLTKGLVVSIENYKPWCDKVSSLPYVRCREKKGTLHYKCIQPYATKEAGYPVDSAHNGNFEEYINAIKDYPNFDLILVDARWRVACALKALDFITDETVVFLHDMNGRRTYYNAVFKWYKEIDRSGSLVAMRRRKNVSRPTLEEYNHYKQKPNW